MFGRNFEFQSRCNCYHPPPTQRSTNEPLCGARRINQRSSFLSIKRSSSNDRASPQRYWRVFNGLIIMNAVLVVHDSCNRVEPDWEIPHHDKIADKIVILVPPFRKNKVFSPFRR